MNEKLDRTPARAGSRRRNADAPDSTCSTDKEVWKSPKDVLALGQVIVKQLELEDRGAVLDRWLAHHLAEVIAEAARATGKAKAASEAQAVDLILKLWVHRRALPEPVDPLGGFRKAVEVLGRLSPEADPWSRFRQPDGYDGLLHEMFGILSRIVLFGLVLTRVSRARPIAAEESKGLEEEEAYLQSRLAQWAPFFSRPQPEPEIRIKFTDPDAAQGSESNDESERPDGSGGQDRVPDDQVEPDDVRLHTAILADLERMQANLANLLTRWRESQPSDREGGDDTSAGILGDRPATEADSVDIRDARVSVRKETRADAADAEATRSDRDQSFWSSVSLTELSEAQGVAPVEDLEGMAALWPSDDDPDDMLAHVLEDRAARRRVVENDPDR